MRPSHLRELFSELVLLEGRVRSSVDTQLRNECGLAFSRFEVLASLASREATQIRDLVAAPPLTTGGASSVVDRLVDDGLCRRRPDLNDPRSSLVELTSDGARMLAVASETVEATLRAELGSPLNAESLRRFATLLRAVEASAGNRG